MGFVKEIATVALPIVALGTANVAHADIGGTVEATIVLENGCIINGVNTTDEALSVTFGEVDFGTQTTQFTDATAQVLNPGGADITIQCTTGIAPALTFTQGLHDPNGAALGHTRAMQNTDGTAHYVSYDLLNADNSVINNDDSILLDDDGSAQTITVNGHAYGTAGLTAGTYTDTVTVTLEL